MFKSQRLGERQKIVRGVKRLDRTRAGGPYLMRCNRCNNNKAMSSLDENGLCSTCRKEH